jgi:hypothetical protein
MLLAEHLDVPLDHGEPGFFGRFLAGP